MRRRLFNAAAIVSLILCVVSAALWLESLRGSDFAYRATSTSQVTLALGAGELSLDYIGGFHNKSPATPEVHFDHTSGPISLGRFITQAMGRPLHTWERFGFFAIVSATAPEWLGHLSLIAAPLWSVFIVFSILPTIGLKRILQSRQKRREGLCPICGYDLRATPDRCPECGHIVTNTTI